MGGGVTSATTCAPLSWRGGGRPAPRGGKVPGCRGPRPLAPPPPGLGPSRVCGRAPSRLAGLYSRPCVAACCGARAGGAHAPELREPRPHLWPPALAPGAPRRKARVAGRGFPPTVPKEQPPKTTPRLQSLPTAAATRVADKREPGSAGALPRCFSGTTDAREPAPGERVGGQIREAAGWGG